MEPIAAVIMGASGIIAIWINDFLGGFAFDR